MEVLTLQNRLKAVRAEKRFHRENWRKWSGYPVRQ